MRHPKIAILIAAMAVAGPVAAANFIDQSQANHPVYMAGFDQSDLAQSFTA